jgi:hypothetical protein
MECLRQRAEHIQQQLVQGEEDLIATEAEFISMLTQSQSQDVEARNCDEQARDRHIIYAQNHQMGRGMSLLQRATHDAEEDAVQEEILAAHIERKEREANVRAHVAEQEIPTRDAILAVARRWCKPRKYTVHTQREDTHENVMITSPEIRRLEHKEVQVDIQENQTYDFLSSAVN